jgi:hypothetical protein
MLTAFNDKLVAHAVDNGYKLVADVVDDNIQRFAEFRHKVLNLRRISVHRFVTLCTMKPLPPLCSNLCTGNTHVLSNP